MNKSLITEISRIHEMMGIKTNIHKLLLEWREIFGASGKEYTQETTEAIVKQEFKNMVEDLSPKYGKNSLGKNMVYDDFVELGKRYAKSAGEDITDEAAALSYFFRTAGSDAMKDYQRVLTKMKSKDIERAAITLEANAVEKAKKELVALRQDMNRIRTGLEDGTLDITTVKKNVDDVVTFMNSQPTTVVNKAMKEALIPEMQSMSKQLDDFNKVLPEAGTSKSGTNFAEELEQKQIQDLFDQQQAQKYKVDPKLDPNVKTSEVPTLGKNTNTTQTLETIPKKSQPLGFGNESTITETFSRNTNYQNKLRKIYGKMFSFMKDSQKKYLDIIDEVERTNMENFKRSLIERFQKDGITEITVTAKDWMNKVKSGNATAGRSTKMTIEEFEKEIENYFLFTTKDNKWSPLNKIDTNYKSNSKEFWTLLKTLYPEDAQKMLKEGLTDSDFDKIIKDLETKILNNDPTLKKYLNNWLVDDPTDTNGFLSDVLINSKTGKEIETIANTFADKFSKNVADVSEGSPYDILLNLDGIRRLSQDTPFGKQGELKTIQTKKVAGIRDLGNGRYYITTLGKMEIPKQDQVDILFLSTSDGKTLAMGKQTPYLNPLGKKSFPSSLRTKRGGYGFFVDSDTPKMSSL